MNLSNTKMCPLCEIHIKTISHDFLECTYVLALWNQIEKWIKSNTNKLIKFSNIDKILRRHTSEELVEKIILSIIKVVIFNNRKNGKQHHINDVKRALFRQLCRVEYQATLSLQENEFNVWEPVYKELYDKYSK